jgi:hypothetical protein
MPSASWPDIDIDIGSARRAAAKRKESPMFIALGIILGLVWLVSVAVVKVSSLGVHILLFFVAASIFAHLFRRASKSRHRVAKSEAR